MWSQKGGGRGESGERAGRGEDTWREGGEDNRQGGTALPEDHTK
jgi:hypothetical protein